MDARQTSLEWTRMFAGIGFYRGKFLNRKCRPDRAKGHAGYYNAEQRGFMVPSEESGRLIPRSSAYENS
jgi:hypothetical protein